MWRHWHLENIRGGGVPSLVPVCVSRCWSLVSLFFFHRSFCASPRLELQSSKWTKGADVPLAQENNKVDDGILSIILLHRMDNMFIAGRQDLKVQTPPDNLLSPSNLLQLYRDIIGHSMSWCMVVGVNSLTWCRSKLVNVVSEVSQGSVLGQQVFLRTPRRFSPYWRTGITVILTA